MKKIILIKLGGSLITEKDKPFTSRDTVITSLAAELKHIIERQNDTYFLLGNGAGSFGHYPAQKYNIVMGMKNKEQLFGFAAVQDGVARLNRIVVHALLEQEIPACSLHPSTFLTSSDGKKKELFTSSLLGYLDKKLLPVIYGDIVYDDKKGCHIFSTEELFSLLIPELLQNKYRIEKIIHLTAVSGVLDKNNHVISLITRGNIADVRENIFTAEGFDVTGGMLHKIETALEYTRHDIKTYIIQGDTQDNLLTKAILEETIMGTAIM